MIKKRRYWPRGVYVYAINDYFRSKNIGNVGCLSGEWDEIESDIFVLKDPNYNIMMMSIFSGLNVSEGQKEERRMATGVIVNFKYPENVANNYRYRGAVEITMP